MVWSRGSEEESAGPRSKFGMGPLWAQSRPLTQHSICKCGASSDDAGGTKLPFVTTAANDSFEPELTVFGFAANVGFRVDRENFKVSDENRIDHRDHPGKHRDAVFRYVREALDFVGETPENADFFVGDWTMAFDESHTGKQPVPFQRQSFHENGSAPCSAIDGSFDNPKDRWVFHDNKSLSLWTYIDPMPEYGINEPTYEENRYHTLKMDEKKFVLFNGDASIVMIFDRI